MRLLLSSLLLGLMWFAAVNVITSLMAWPLGAWLLGRFRIPPPRRVGASMLLTVRLLPLVASLAFVLAVFLPAHWRFEPADADESFGLVLGALSAVGLLLALRSAGRAARGALACHRLARLTQRTGDRIEGDATVIAGLPGVSLAGIWRPRILIGSHVLSALTPAELDVAISHEVAHRRSQDNLKRFLLYCAPDFFGSTRVARQLEEQWQAEAECEADAAAVEGDGQRAVMLASALVKVARLGSAGTIHQVSRAGTRGTPAWSSPWSPPWTPPWIMWCAFHVPTLLELRVRRLVSTSSVPPAARRRLRWSSATLGLGIPVGLLWLSGFSYTLHLVTEVMVTHLP